VFVHLWHLIYLKQGTKPVQISKSVANSEIPKAGGFAAKQALLGTLFAPRKTGSHLRVNLVSSYLIISLKYLHYLLFLHILAGEVAKVEAPKV
jgi:hypothetical protein